MIVGFVGLSHLGLTHCIGAASKGFNVIAVDKNKELIENLKLGKLSIEEPNISDLLALSFNRILFTTEFLDLQKCDLVFISQDVPTNSEGESELEEIQNLIIKTNNSMKKDSCLVILSQIPPGFCRKMTNKIGNPLFYQVETLIFGQAMERYLKPERFIIGLSNKNMPMHSCHQKYLDSFESKIIKMDFESAELTKISINILLSASISVTNVLSELAENLGANWLDIEKSLRLDKRFGKYAYLSTGLGISGGNIERDLNTAEAISKKFNLYTLIFDAIKQNSEYRKLWPSRIISRELPLSTGPHKIAIWGIAYKKNTHSIKNSPAIKNLLHLGPNYTFFIYDPIVKFTDEVGSNIFWCTNMYDTLVDTDALVIFNDSDEFKKIESTEIDFYIKNKLVVDPYNVLENFNFRKFKYFSLGKM